MKLADFEGRWLVNRRIENAVGPDASFQGAVDFIPDDAGLMMREVGEMAVDGQPPLRATRDYRWCDADDGIDVYFDDGRFFHRIGQGACPEDRHDCAPDLYRVTYDFSAWPEWTSLWRVTGPRKDYVMRTRFSRG